MQALLTVILFFNFFGRSTAVEKVSYFAQDSVKIDADLFLNNYKLPFILLFHNSEGSKGEFVDIAPRLLNLGYNCLAVDLRVGNKSNYIQNETAINARNLDISRNFIDCWKDIEASIQYVKKFNDKPIILFGSSFSASLCLMIAKENDRIKSVIAFSPGEFFRPEIIVKDKIKDLSIPVFISSTNLEYEYVIELLSGVSENYKTIYRPKNSKGLHGTKMLDKENEEARDCWLELLLFFKKINSKIQ